MEFVIGDWFADDFGFVDKFGDKFEEIEFDRVGGGGSGRFGNSAADLSRGFLLVSGKT